MPLFPGTSGVDGYDNVDLPLDGTESLLVGQSGFTKQGTVQNVSDFIAPIVLGLVNHPPLYEASFLTNKVTATTAITDVDLLDGHQIELTLTADTKVNLLNPPADGQTYQLPFKVLQDVTGGWSLNALWQVAGVDISPKYRLGDAPLLTGTPSSLDDLHVQISNTSGVYTLYVSEAIMEWL